MTKLDENLLANAQNSPWDLANAILYEMCEKHPSHRYEREILAKMLIIGRVYAAAIERRPRKADELRGDQFYLQKVVAGVQQGRLDDLIAEAREISLASCSAVDDIVTIHGKVAKIFRDIASIGKDSLASKYLHFHAPQAFFILDSRAKRALAKIWDDNQELARLEGKRGDYRWLVERCVVLKRFCEERHPNAGPWTPRKIDNLLLNVAESAISS